MNGQKILKQAETMQEELQAIRRDLHQHPELGLELAYTKEKVKKELIRLGYEPKECGNGIVALAGKKPGKTFMLRADMDALPIKEEAEVEYKSREEGKMHGCGHDMHTAMLLGAARLLKEHEDEICGTVKLMFQPGEEIFLGAQDMIKNGVLDHPKVDVAMMIHVIAGTPMPKGLVTVPGGGISMASCEQYHIKVKGKGGHGSMPSLAIDPITAAAHIHIALQEINSRELEGSEYGVFTTCRFEAGKTSNVIPDEADMWGTIRTIDPKGKVGAFIKQRICEIAKGVAEAYRASAEVTFYDYCPCMVIDADTASSALQYTKELLGKEAMGMAELGMDKPAGGSEDFAFLSHEIPVVSLFLSTGGPKEGYVYSQHNPKVIFDDSVLSRGSAVYAYTALRWLEEHS